MADWHAFLAARDAGAGALWLLAVVIVAILWRLPEKWRPWAILSLTAYLLACLKSLS